MAKTYSQLIIQIVFAVKFRKNLVHEAFREELEKYICGIISKNNTKPLSIYCNPNHIHILIGMKPNISISELVRKVKANSSKWINEKGWLSSKFEWQNGFGAFGYSTSQIKRVATNIENQPIHHQNTSFQNEHVTILNKSDVEYDEKYLFDWYD